MRNALRISIVMAALGAVVAPANADAPPEGFGRRPTYAPAYRSRYAPPIRPHGYGVPRPHGFGYRGAMAVPPPFPGMGEVPPVAITLYREAYIGRGLIYNTPPTLDRPGPDPVLSARY